MTRHDPTHFDETHRWFHGPDFLRKSEDEWPQETVETNSRRGGEIMYDVDTGRNIISRRCDRNYEKSPTNVNGAELTEVCRKCRLRRVICLPNAYVITNPPSRVRGRLFRAYECDDRPQTRKRYGALFTCLTTRAVHIELAESLSSDSMILALRRFIARRGTPSDVFGQRHEFRRRKQRTDEHTRGTREDEERSRRPHHNLKFIPPGAPNMGGAWERLVRSVKTALAATLREEPSRRSSPHPAARSRAHCQLQTVDGAPRRSLLAEVVESTTDSGAPPARGDPICRAPAEGDIVLIVDSSSPRYSWPRGRIKKTYPGPDNQVRVVDVETTGGVLRRPTSKIVVLVSAEATAVPCPEV
ncbi:hypothetical protein EVAR_86474_1 [Eumeta japonica]|uniref:DUF5641 domain-containing protein n=1 Tax=Eumeta variegata TaxID=151549 RepID=A0A4C1VMI4_EUMVA|nr:hypothetical protein EVAR_86474_1 [Eumeta japonica]